MSEPRAYALTVNGTPVEVHADGDTSLL
ncbi:MAG: hypothetical protein QOE40_2555, partial [Actinomycetota bacterium]|nr:hypothetical protein [Actinomycetota bacterium]